MVENGAFWRCTTYVRWEGREKNTEVGERLVFSKIEFTPLSLPRLQHFPLYLCFCTSLIAICRAVTLKKRKKPVERTSAVTRMVTQQQVIIQILWIQLQVI